ncbi:hypothetical protein GGI43DRAFT_98647 [Trichoderma evansii]
MLTRGCARTWFPREYRPGMLLVPAVEAHCQPAPTGTAQGPCSNPRRRGSDLGIAQVHGRLYYCRYRRNHHFIFLGLGCLWLLPVCDPHLITTPWRPPYPEATCTAPFNLLCLGAAHPCCDTPGRIGCFEERRAGSIWGPFFFSFSSVLSGNQYHTTRFIAPFELSDCGLASTCPGQGPLNLDRLALGDKRVFPIRLYIGQRDLSRWAPVSRGMTRIMSQKLEPPL